MNKNFFRKEIFFFNPYITHNQTLVTTTVQSLTKLFNQQIVYLDIEQNYLCQ